MSANFFYCTRCFFEKWGPFKRQFRIFFLTINKIQIYVISLPNNISCSLQSVAAIALKTKNL